MTWYTTNTLKTMETDHGQSICALTQIAMKQYIRIILNTNKPKEKNGSLLTS